MRNGVIALGMVFVLTGAATASSAADATQGLALARSLCSSCHIVGPGEAPSVVNADIPSFMAVAAKEGQTKDRIMANVLNPHPVMPQVQLTNRELDAIATYIMSLKE
jgi:mono/diheme cytochrome c family protein